MKYFILVLTSLSSISLINGEYFSFFVQLTPSIVSILKNYFPNNPVIKTLTAPISPHIYSGIRLSEYSSQMALFSSKCFLVLIIIYSIPLTFKIEVDENSFYLAVFAFALPIFLAMSFVTTVFHTIKYAYVKVMKRDKVWGE